MASNFQFCGDFGASQGSPARGTTSVSGLTNVSFKNLDSDASDYISYPISAGSNSYSKYIFGLWTGSFSQIQSVRFQHVSGVMNSNISLLFGTGLYETPSTSAPSSFTFNLTSTGASATGLGPIQIGGNSPQNATKSSSTTSNPAYSSFIGGQLQTTASAAAGNSAGSPYVFSLSWTEN